MKDTDGKTSHSQTNIGPLSDREGNNQEFIRLYRYRPRLSWLCVGRYNWQSEKDMISIWINKRE